jgi:hypothetical protein
MRAPRTWPPTSRLSLLAPLVVSLSLACAGCGPSVLESYGADGSPTPSPTTTPTPAPPPSEAPRPSPSVPELEIPDLSIPPARTGPVIGGDISWPQCPEGMGIPEKRTLGMPMPLDSAEYVIIGLTNGPGFTPNPCLADQVGWVRERGLMAAAYAVNSYPDDPALARYGDRGPYDGATRYGALSNVGYQQARFNLASLKRAGLLTPVVWLDVEPVPVFAWSPDTRANAAVVVGAARGYTDAGYRIGAYSTQALWSQVVGDLELGIPEWRAAGQTSREEALRRCGATSMFQGGEAVLAQWVELRRDRNITCPGISADLLRWFHQY